MIMAIPSRNSFLQSLLKPSRKKQNLDHTKFATTHVRKDDRWYLDSTAAVHVTHDLSLFITPDLNTDDTELIETASDEQIETRVSGKIDLEMTIDGKNTSATVSNVHYCPELDSNLISLGVL